ncbi:zinc ribbon domain-containing protein [Flaviaesturariibacter terrae]
MNIGKKILSALVEMPEEPRPANAPPTNVNAQTKADSAELDKFRRHFAHLLDEANLPGPDYYEFARMTAAMNMLPEEGARYQAAFAGLQVQGLNKQRLVESAQQYLHLLEEDAQRFIASLASAATEKVEARETELEAQQRRIAELSAELASLQDRISTLKAEIEANSGKLEGARTAYQLVLSEEQARIRQHLEKIQKHIS